MGYVEENVIYYLHVTSVHILFDDVKRHLQTLLRPHYK